MSGHVTGAGTRQLNPGSPRRCRRHAADHAWKLPKGPARGHCNTCCNTFGWTEGDQSPRRPFRRRQPRTNWCGRRRPPLACNNLSRRCAASQSDMWPNHGSVSALPDTVTELRAHLSYWLDEPWSSPNARRLTAEGVIGIMCCSRDGPGPVVHRQRLQCADRSLRRRACRHH